MAATLMLPLPWLDQDFHELVFCKWKSLTLCIAEFWLANVSELLVQHWLRQHKSAIMFHTNAQGAATIMQNTKHRRVEQNVPVTVD